MTDPTPRTEAGRCPTCHQLFSPKGLAIHQGIKHKRGLSVNDRIIFAHDTAYAEGLRDGLAQARTEALDVEALTVAISTVIKAVDRNPGGLWPVDGVKVAREYQRILAAKETP